MSNVHEVDIVQNFSVQEPVISMDRMLACFKVIEAALPDHKSRIIQFIASRQGEGSSTIAREFAMAVALRVGKSVLLLDANRINPTQHQFFRLDIELEGSDCLEGHPEGVYQFKDSCLFVAPASGTAQFSGKIFDSSKINELWSMLRQRFEFIIIDAVPLELSSDGLAIAAGVDGVIMVVEAEKTSAGTAKETRDTLMKVGANLLGIIFNKSRDYTHRPIFPIFGNRH